jgi:transposase InsO family protein
LINSLQDAFECQVATKQHTEEPIKPTVIPQKPWEEIAIDFGGPYPDGHYNLVAIDKRTRYPEIDVTYSTSFKPTQAKLKRMFAHHGTPQRVDSDNGSPFNSEEFAQFAQHEGFTHHRITPEHPRANAEAERFMQTINKTEQIAHLQGKRATERELAVQNMLIAYRDTPHPATGVTPYEAMHGRAIRTRLDYDNARKIDHREKDKEIDERDKEYKKSITDQKRNAKKHKFALKDYVLLKLKKTNNWTTAFEPAFYTITKIQGSSITIRRIKDGRELCRDASQLKLANSLVGTKEYPMQPDDDEEEEESTWDRETDEETADDEVEQVRPAENEGIDRPRRERQQPARLRDYILS